MNDKENLKKEKFLKLARKNVVARLLLQQIGPLHIQLKETTLEQIEKWIALQGLQIERPAIIAAARLLEKQEIARFVVGRRGSPSRLEWGDFDTSELFDAPQSPGAEPQNPRLVAVESDFDDGSNVEDLFDDDLETGESGDTVSPAGAAANDVASRVIEHSFRVRPDFPITLRLPTDLSGAEADRLAAWIKTLPF